MAEVVSRKGAEDEVRMATLDAIRRARAGSRAEESQVEGPETAEDDAARPPRDGRILGGRSSRPWSSETWVDCPDCGEGIAVDPRSSVLESSRCEECGRMLAFDEMIKLRAAEHARASRYF